MTQRGDWISFSEVKHYRKAESGDVRCENCKYSYRSLENNELMCRKNHFGDPVPVEEGYTCIMPLWDKWEAENDPWNH